jgi:hypothetical protein
MGLEVALELGSVGFGIFIGVPHIYGAFVL